MWYLFSLLFSAVALQHTTQPVSGGSCLFARLSRIRTALISFVCGLEVLGTFNWTWDSVVRSAHPLFAPRYCALALWRTAATLVLRDTFQSFRIPPETTVPFKNRLGILAIPYSRPILNRSLGDICFGPWKSHHARVAGWDTSNVWGSIQRDR